MKKLKVTLLASSVVLAAALLSAYGSNQKLKYKYQKIKSGEF